MTTSVPPTSSKRTSTPPSPSPPSSGRAVGHDRFEVTGVLTVRDQSRPLTLHATVTSAGSSATVAVEAEIDRSMWGISWAKMGSGLKNQVAIRARFDRV